MILDRGPDDLPSPNPKGLSIEEQVDEVLEKTDFKDRVTQKRDGKYESYSREIEFMGNDQAIVDKAYEMIQEKTLIKGDSYEDGDTGRELTLSPQLYGNDLECESIHVEVYKAGDEDKDYTIIVGLVSPSDVSLPDALLLKKINGKTSVSILSGGEMTNTESIAKIEKQKLVSNTTCLAVIATTVGAILRK